LREVGRLLDAHRHTFVSKLAKWRDDHAEVLGGFRKFESVILHGDVDFGKILIARAFLEDILDERKWIDLATDNFIKFSKVANPSYTSIFLGCDKRR
jgi:hypothetical protein